MWWHHEGFGWFAVFGGLFWLLILGLIVYLIVSLVTPTRERRLHDEDPLEIAKRRYARGDISREEFERIRSDLTGRSPPG